VAFKLRSPVRKDGEVHALNVRFDLDVCSPGLDACFVPADACFTVMDDGLIQDWGDRFVWCNPPYGPATSVWMGRMDAHRNGIALVFARTDTDWFQLCRPDVVVFIDGRVHFYQGGTSQACRKGTPGAGSMLLGWGERAREALAACGLGVLMAPVGAQP